MKIDENTYKLVAVILLCTSIASGALAVNYNYKLRQLDEGYQTTLEELEKFTVEVDLLIDYGNGSLVWYNDTRVKMGASLLNATVDTLAVDYQTLEYGAFVTSINGLEQDDSHFWVWSYYDGGWKTGSVGADQHVLHDGDIVGWTYTSFQ